MPTASSEQESVIRAVGTDHLTHLSDEALLESLNAVCFEARRLFARLVLHLIEVEARRLDLRSACSSLFDFCIRRLGMSESQAVRRIDAARLVKRFPPLLEALERGDLHVTAMLSLRDHFTSDNVAELVAAARGKSKREISELVAAMAPKSDVMATLTPLLPSTPPAPSTAPAPDPSRTCAELSPLSPTRHRLELTVSSEVRAKLERARDLLGHSVPDGDLEAVLDSALDALLTKIEKGRTKLERVVYARDGEHCTFTDEHGNRCNSRRCVELDHIVPRACGGPDDASNLRVVCRAHNRLYAEQVFGQEHVERQIYLRQRRSTDETHEVARRALTGMGFRDKDVRQAVARLRPVPDAMPDLIRAAIGLLTPG